MFEIAVQIVIFGVVLAIVAVILQAAFRPNFQFVIQINGDMLTIVKGKVRADFVDEAREVCREFGVTSGWIGGVKRGKSVALKFSRNFPPSCQQRLRNLWFTPSHACSTGFQPVPMTNPHRLEACATKRSSSRSGATVFFAARALSRKRPCGTQSPPIRLIAPASPSTIPGTDDD